MHCSLDNNFFTMLTGKGTQKWKNGAVYDGDWKDNKMHGFGTLSIPDNDGGYKRLYAGGWKNGKRHVSFLNFLSQFSSKSL